MGSCRPRYRSGYRVVSLVAYADDIPGGAAESQYHQAASSVIPRTDMSDNGKRGEEGLGNGCRRQGAAEDEDEGRCTRY